VHLAAGLLELAGAAGDREGQADAVDEELAPAGDDEGGVAEDVTVEATRAPLTSTARTVASASLLRMANLPRPRGLGRA
jgi:hypothetical protein